MKYFTEEIVDMIRSRSLAAEQNGGLAAEVLTYIYEQRLFKLFVPEELNGSLLCFPKAITVFEECAYIDGSFGWLVMIGSGGSYFAPIFAPEVSAELFSPENAVVAGSGHANGRAKQVDGGYRVTGSWRYCSGAAYATIFTANCLLPDNSIRSFIFTPDQVHIVNDWDAYGLCATGSHTISVSDTFVPDHMTFDIADGERHYEDTVYYYPFTQFAEASFAAVSVGICRHFFEEALAALELHKSSGMVDRYDFVYDLIVKQQGLLNDARETFHETVERSWEALLHDHEMPEDMQAQVSLMSKNITKVVLLTSQTIYPYLGLNVTMQSNPINRCWRDLHTASQHILLRSFE